MRLATAVFLLIATCNVAWIAIILSRSLKLLCETLIKLTFPPMFILPEDQRPAFDASLKQPGSH